MNARGYHAMLGVPWWVWGVGAYLWYKHQQAPALIPGVISGPAAPPDVQMTPGGQNPSTWTGPLRPDLLSQAAQAVSQQASIWAGGSPAPAGAVNGYRDVVAFRYDGYGRRR